MEVKTSVNGSVSFIELLQIVFIVLKLCGIINWSWVWVLSPLWISITVMIIVVFIFAIKIRRDKSHDR
jgi:ABC-type siderophore export system fused ATPase/permease subunit